MGECVPHQCHQLLRCVPGCYRVYKKLGEFVFIVHDSFPDSSCPDFRIIKGNTDGDSCTSRVLNYLPTEALTDCWRYQNGKLESNWSHEFRANWFDNTKWLESIGAEFGTDGDIGAGWTAYIDLATNLMFAAFLHDRVYVHEHNMDHAEE